MAAAGMGGKAVKCQRGGDDRVDSGGGDGGVGCDDVARGKKGGCETGSRERGFRALSPSLWDVFIHGGDKRHTTGQKDGGRGSVIQECLS